MEKKDTNDRLTLFYDGACPVCSREMRFLKKKDTKNLLAFIDVSADGFKASDYNKDQDAFMKQIHAILPDGSLITGMEVFRQAYQRVGHGWLLFPTKFPVIKQCADIFYALFAKNRMKISKFLSRCGMSSCSID